jgi:hypothetical protein
MALICQNCRLVNGQAPPGTKTLADLGRWRCFSCGSWDGEEDEAVKIMQEMKEIIETSGPDQSSPGNEGSEDAETRAGKDEEDDSAKDADANGQEDADSAEETIEVKPTRGRSKGSRKKA